jgi:hypothetical protein
MPFVKSREDAPISTQHFYIKSAGEMYADCVRESLASEHKQPIENRLDDETLRQVCLKVHLPAKPFHVQHELAIISCVTIIGMSVGCYVLYKGAKAVTSLAKSNAGTWREVALWGGIVGAVLGIAQSIALRAFDSDIPVVSVSFALLVSCGVGLVVTNGNNKVKKNSPPV